MNDPRIQPALADLDQLVAGLEEHRRECRQECLNIGFDTEIATPLTNGLIDIARKFLELGHFEPAREAMQRVLSAAELEWDLIGFQAYLEDIKDEQNKEID